MSTSSTARSSSSSGTAGSAVEPHLYIPAIKELPAIPKKTAKASSPRLSLASERKALRRLKKKAITKTVQGSITKVRRRYPGTASLRDTSSEGSISSNGDSAKLKLKVGTGRKSNLAQDGLKKPRSDGEVLTPTSFSQCCIRLHFFSPKGLRNHNYLSYFVSIFMLVGTHASCDAFQ